MKKIIVFVMLFVFLIGFSSISSASIEMTPRAAGMGGAFTAVADDFTAVIYNPAGLSGTGPLGAYISIGENGLGDIEKMADILEYFADNEGLGDLNQLTEITEGKPLNSQLFGGIHLGNFALAINSHYNLNQNVDLLDEDLSAEAILGFGERFPFPFINSIHYGVNLKLLYDQNTEYDIATGDKNTVFEGSGFGVDAGILLQITENLKAGMQVKNIFAQEYLMEEQLTGTDSYLITPEMSARFGSSLYIPLLDLTLAADVSGIKTDNIDEMEPVFHFGAEKNLLFNIISLRGGTYISPDEIQKYTMGLGLKVLFAHADLAISTTEDFSEEQMMVLSGGISF